MAGLNETPAANRWHIGVFGRRNSGKSSLINALAGQEASIVSDIAGTTTDPVYKPLEIHGLGASVLMDTAGFDDVGALGEMRVEKTKKAADKADLAIVLFSNADNDGFEQELRWLREFKENATPVIPVISKSDAKRLSDGLRADIEREATAIPEEVSSVTGDGIDRLRARIVDMLSQTSVSGGILGGLAKDGDFVLLVMPQDIQAPTGRLILPQVQTIRELLDKKCIVMCVTTDKLEAALKAASEPPSLIVTDSQVFGEVYEKKPAKSKLTSFSILFAAYKGDLKYYMEGIDAVEKLSESSRVLIAECCAHAPLEEDIGRVKIPRLLRKRVGEALTIDVVSGADFPDLQRYDLIIQCGGCMFNRKHIISRINKAKAQCVPMTNYGVLMAYLSGIFDKAAYPC